MEEKNIVIDGKEYNLSKIDDEQLIKLHEYIVQKGNNLMKKIDSEIGKIS